MVLRNWAGNVEFSTEVLHEPKTVEELQEIVAGSERIRALGSRHSFSRVADTAGELVDVRGPDLPIEVDGDTVVVPGGTRYAELAPVLHAHGRALAAMGSLPHISVAGACATGTHGSGDANRCLAAAAVGVEFVRADGTLVTVEAGDADFPGSVLALGALGVVTRLRLTTVPAYDLRQDLWLDAPLDTLDLDAVLGSAYSVSLFSDLRRPGVVGQIWVKSAAGPVDGTRWGAVPATEPQHPITGEDASTATEQLGVPGAWYARLPHFRPEFTPSNGAEQQTEYLVAREDGPAAMRAVWALDLAGALLVSEIRSVAADDLWLSPAHGRDSVALHFTWVLDDARVRPAVAAVEAALAPFDPRPHWGKVFALPPDDVRAHYPRLADFRALAARYDPDRKFGNAFLERYVY